MAKLDKTKFPLIGIAKFLEEESMEGQYPVETGRKMAKGLLTRVMTKSRTATEEDKEEAKKEMEALQERMRESAKKEINTKVIMKDPTDLKVLKGLERMTISLPDYNLLKEDIKERGVQVPLLITPNDEIVWGRHRHLAAKELGLKEVPVMYLEGDKPLKWVIKMAIKDNVCRRQLTKEDRVHYVKLLSEMGEKRKGRGRPSKNESSDSIKPSSRELAKELGVSQSTANRDLIAAEGRKLGREYEDIDKKFGITIGKSKERDENFLNEILDFIKENYKWLNPNKGDSIEVTLKIRVGRKAVEE